MYKNCIEEITRNKPYILSIAEETMLAMIESISQGPKSIFSIMNNADIKFSIIKDENGDPIEVTKGRFLGLMASPYREVRKATFEAFYGSYKKQSYTFAATLSANVKVNIFNCKTRKY